MPSNVVTLLVTPEQAERITLAQTNGSITLVLRNPLDVMPTETSGVRMAGLMGSPSTAPVEKPAQSKRSKASANSSQSSHRRRRRRQPRPIVETIRAGKRTVEDVK